MERLRPNDHVEIERFGNFDVLVNKRQTTLTNPELMDLRGRIIQDLMLFPNEKPFDCWEITDHLRVNTSVISGKKYASKRKWVDKHYWALTDSIKIDRQTADMEDLKQKKRSYAVVSLLNEMSISLAVNKILKTEIVLRLCKEARVDSVDLAEPLVGVIDRISSKKYLVYEFKNGIPVSDYGGGSDRFVKLCMNLYDVFTQYNITPSDMSSAQFLVESTDKGEPTLHLLDIEMFHKA